MQTRIHKYIERKKSSETSKLLSHLWYFETNNLKLFFYIILLFWPCYTKIMIIWILTIKIGGLVQNTNIKVSVTSQCLLKVKIIDGIQNFLIYLYIISKYSSIKHWIPMDNICSCFDYFAYLSGESYVFLGFLI